MAEELTGFFSRWARRKATASDETRPEEPASPAKLAPREVQGLRPANPGEVATPVAKQPALVPDQPERVLSLDDVRFLTKDSDFKPFMAKGVGPEVRNAAMKKLFADPHFNVMDGLDTYIDDYSRSDPIPEAMLRQMTSAKMLGLFDDEEDGAKNGKIQDLALPREDANNPSPQSVAQLGETIASASAIPAERLPAGSIDSSPAHLSPEAPEIASQEDHANTDLRLQPDHAAPAKDAGRGTW